MTPQSLPIEMYDRPRSRRTDPQTSHVAAQASRYFASGQKARILAALRQHGPMSPARMFDFTGLDVAQCDRRRKELLRAGLIRIQTLEDGSVVTDQGCEVWEAVEINA